MENKEIDLLEELAIATAPKPQPGMQGTDPDFAPEMPGPTIPLEDESDFAPPPPPEQDPVAEQLIEASYKPEELADLIIEGASALMEHGLPMLYESTLNKEDRTSLKKLALKYRQQKNQSTLTLDEEDQRVMEIYLDLEEYKEICPMDEDDKNNVRKPLIEVLKKTNYQTTPENALMISAGIIVLPRLLPIIKNKL